MRTLAWTLALVAACGAHRGDGDAGVSGDLGGATPDLAGCVPSCGGKSCGSDGCAGVCGTCATAQLCMNGACANTSAGIELDGAPLQPIAPEIYGMAFAPASLVTALAVPLNRWGGNGTSRYNWQTDVHNTGNDYFFENLGAHWGEANPCPSGPSSADQMIGDDKSAGAATLMTVPTIGWTPKGACPTAHPLTCGFPVARYGAEQKTDPYDPNCGNGVTSGGAPISGDPTSTSMASTPAFEKSWLDHLVATFGPASAGGVRFYQLDNEMNLWSSTHADVHPKPVSYDEVWQATSSYAPIIRAADASATILGYTSWGVLDLFESALDTANHNDADQKAHGGLPLAEWYLQQLAAYDKANGVRLVDCLDLHYYPQGGDPLESTRSLWDPSYHDPSWIDGWLGEPVQLLPRLRGFIAAQYPGTGICVSEYNFNLGSESDPKSALVEADVLGLFGKFGVRLAAYWTHPIDGQGNLQPAAEAFRVYRNYDGKGGRFGTSSTGAATSLANVAVYAATDGATLTAVIINKATSALSTTVAVRDFSPAASAQVYQYVAQPGGKLTRLADLAVANASLTLAMPALAMDLLVIAKGK